MAGLHLTALASLAKIIDSDAEACDRVGGCLHVERERLQRKVGVGHRSHKTNKLVGNAIPLSPRCSKAKSLRGRQRQRVHGMGDLWDSNRDLNFIPCFAHIKVVHPKVKQGQSDVVRERHPWGVVHGFDEHDDRGITFYRL